MAVQRLYISTEEYFALPYASNSGVKEAHSILNSGGIAPQDEVPSYYMGSSVDAVLTDPETIHTLNMSREERATIIPMARAIEKDATYQALFSPDAGGERQAVFVDMEFPITIDGMQVFIPAKCKFDWWNPKPKLNFGGDLKTTICKDQRAFDRAAEWFDYDQQGAWYMDISGSDRFVILAVSKYNYAIFKWSIKRGDKFYQSGREKYLRRSASWFKLNGAA